MIVLGNEVLEVLTGVGTFTSINSSLHFVTISELKKVYARRFVNFYFLLGSSIPLSTSAQGDVSRKMGRMYHLSIAKEYFSVEVKHNLRIALMNNTQPKGFSIDFIHFKYCF